MKEILHIFCLVYSWVNLIANVSFMTVTFVNWILSSYKFNYFIAGLEEGKLFKFATHIWLPCKHSKFW